MTRARELGKLANKNSLTADNTNNFVGIGSTQPDARLDVDGTVLVGTAITLGGASGIVSATSFYGDGSNLDGVASAGLGTALAETQPGSVIYYTDSVLGIGSTVVVDPPTSTNVAYTQYSEISVDENVDFIVAEGDDFVPDILGIGTVGITTLTGIGGRIRAGTFTNKAGTGAPQLTFGAEIPVGYGLTGAGGINVGGAATIGGNLTVGGVLTYEDVTNIDSLGIITARSDVSIADSIFHTGDTNTAIRFPAADTFTVETGGSEALRVDSDGRLLIGHTAPGENNNMFEVSTTYGGRIGFLRNDTSTSAGNNLGMLSFYGNDSNGTYQESARIQVDADLDHATGDKPGRITFLTSPDGSNTPAERLRITSTGGVHFNNAELIERVNITAGKLSDNQNINLDNGMAHLFTTTETTTSTPNIISTAGINTNMATGDVLSVSIITTAAAAGYSERVKIDGLLTGITTSWNGGSAPSAGGSSGKDFYSYTIIKTGDAAFTVLGNLSNFA